VRFGKTSDSLTPRTAASSHRAEIALHGVYEISKILATPAPLDTTLSNVLTLLSSFLDMHHGIIALLDEQGEPHFVVGCGWSEQDARSHFARLPERAIGQIVTTRMPVIIEDAAHNPLFAEWSATEWADETGSICFIGVPIKERDRVIGTLTLDRVCEGQATIRFDEDIRFLAMIANLVGQTVRLHDIIGRDRERLMSEQRRLEKELSETVRPDRPTNAHGIIGGSSAIRSVIDKIEIVARSNTTVLLRGESGTGKELFARAVHDLSPRKKAPFVKLNCAALSETMLESELFGHERGAFTGALTLHKGRFELAHGGTLFLDEIGEISPSFQAKLLRVLQEGEFERVGGTKTLKVDVRLITATNRNLEDDVAHGKFRADLYYRINVISIALPPLRDRPEDVSLLAGEFLRRFNEEHGVQLSLSASARGVLEGCYFPGNVRELENCVRRTATLAKESKIVADDFACRHDECLSATLWRGAIPSKTPLTIIAKPTPSPPAKVVRPVDSDTASDQVEDCPQSETASALHGDGPTERERLLQAMETSGWVQAKAARLLQLTPRQIGYALRKHNIPIKKF